MASDVVKAAWLFNQQDWQRCRSLRATAQGLNVTRVELDNHVLPAIYGFITSNVDIENLTSWAALSKETRRKLFKDFLESDVDDSVTFLFLGSGWNDCSDMYEEDDLHPWDINHDMPVGFKDIAFFIFCSIFHHYFKGLQKVGSKKKAGKRNKTSSRLDSTPKRSRTRTEENAHVNTALAPLSDESERSSESLATHNHPKPHSMSRIKNTKVRVNRRDDPNQIFTQDQAIFTLFSLSVDLSNSNSTYAGFVHTLSLESFAKRAFSRMGIEQNSYTIWIDELSFDGQVIQYGLESDDDLKVAVQNGLEAKSEYIDIHVSLLSKMHDRASIHSLYTQESATATGSTEAREIDEVSETTTDESEDGHLSYGAHSNKSRFRTPALSSMSTNKTPGRPDRTKKQRTVR